MNGHFTVPGMVYGRLTVIEPGPPIPGSKKKTWKCRCSCGTMRIYRQEYLRSGHTSSCGCFQREAFSKRRTTHGKSDTAEYHIWSQMKTRCLCSTVPGFKDYGGRGIKVCDRWRNSFAAFIQDMGPRPSLAHSIDRVNNDGNYEPGNCRWAIGREQARNTRRNHMITANGMTMSIAGWAERSNIRPQTISRRLRVYGWPADEAVGIQLRKTS